MNAAWIGAAGAGALAVVAGIAERRRKRRTNLDRIGMLDWPTVQIFALIALAVCVGLGMHADQ